MAEAAATSGSVPPLVQESFVFTNPISQRFVRFRGVARRVTPFQPYSKSCSHTFGVPSAPFLCISALFSIIVYALGRTASAAYGMS